MRAFFDRIQKLNAKLFARLRGRLAIVAVVLIATSLANGVAAYAQPPGPMMRREAKPIPSDRYYRGVELIHAGRFSDAVRFYQNEINNGMKIGASLWIDSICYYAMMGEAYYRAGALDDALKQYNSALSLATAFPSWTAKVTYTTGVAQSPKGAAPWGASRRASPLGIFPSRATILIGEGETAVHKQLGVRSEQRAIPIDPIEIFRCIALSMRRRVEIIGPLAPFDPMSAQLMEAFRNRAVAPNHWSNAMFDVIWAYALEACDKTPSAVKRLNDALLAAGQCDHNLTGAALYELGEIFLKSNKLREAAECYYEASISAYHYGDALLVEEALRKYSNASKALRRGAADPVVENAYLWAKTRKNDVLLRSSFGLELVEDLIYSGKLKTATSGLNSIDAMMRGEMRSTRAADRWNYLKALSFYAVGDMKEGDAFLARVVEGEKSRSTWARHLMKLDEHVKRGLATNGLLTPRNAIDLYEYLLREPTVVDWAARPTESLAIQMIAPIDSFERYFGLLLDRDLKDRAFEVAERIRRERFFATQTYGGRLISLRYILTCDDALATPSIRAARESLLFEYPDFSDAMKAIDMVNRELDELPTIVVESDQKKRQTALFDQLEQLSERQEALLRFIAAGRVRIPYVFPPVYSVDEIQKRLPKDTAILAFISAEGQTYGFMIGKENFDAWRIGATAQLGDAIAIFLKTIGVSEGVKQIEASELAAAHWKSQGAKLREIILGASDVEADRFNIVFSKLVVVPDANLWYLPFEALCLPKFASDAEDEEEGAEALDAPDADAANNENPAENPEGEAEGEPNPENEVDIDAAYLDDEADGDESDPTADEAPADEEPAEGDDGAAEEPADAADDEDAPVVTEEPIEAAPVKRKSKAARMRDQLQAYEDSLISMLEAPEFTIRYSATASLALPNAIGRNAHVETTVIASSIFPHEKSETVEAAVERLANAVPKTVVAAPKTMDPIPGAIFASRARRLVVWEEIVANDWNWAPIVLGKNRAGNSVSAWIASPWGAPRLIVIPALRTRGENLAKNGGVGSELFLPILAMQASGADAMLLSRWRTGGRSCYDLTRDFVAGYEKEPVADAWKRAANDLIARDVVPEEEPRLRKLGLSEEIPKYDSPFWWAGYMLVDSGEAVSAEELERLDEDAVKKAEDENALLEGGNGEKVGEGADPNAQPGAVQGKETATGADADATNAGSESGKDDSGLDDDAPFNLGPTPIKDEELERLDEEGDDFFAPDDDAAPSAPTVAPQLTAPADDPKVDVAPELDDDPTPAKPEAKEEPKDVPKDFEKDAPKDSPKDSPKEDSPKDDGKSSAATEKKSSGRLTLKGKGKSK